MNWHQKFKSENIDTTRVTKMKSNQECSATVIDREEMFVLVWSLIRICPIRPKMHCGQGISSYCIPTNEYPNKQSAKWKNFNIKATYQNSWREKKSVREQIETTSSLKATCAHTREASSKALKKLKLFEKQRKSNGGQKEQRWCLGRKQMVRRSDGI